METSLHRELKQRYAGAARRSKSAAAATVSTRWPAASWSRFSTDVSRPSASRWRSCSKIMQCGSSSPSCARSCSCGGGRGGKVASRRTQPETRPARRSVRRSCLFHEGLSPSAAVDRSPVGRHRGVPLPGARHRRRGADAAIIRSKINVCCAWAIAGCCARRPISSSWRGANCRRVSIPANSPTCSASPAASRNASPIACAKPVPCGCWASAGQRARVRGISGVAMARGDGQLCCPCCVTLAERTQTATPLSPRQAGLRLLVVLGSSRVLDELGCGHAAADAGRPREKAPILPTMNCCSSNESSGKIGRATVSALLVP